MIFMTSIFEDNNPYVFLKTLLALIYSYFEKRVFLKVPKRNFWPVLFSNIWLRHRKFCQNRVFIGFWGIQKINLVDLKQSTKQSWKTAPPRVNPRSAPGVQAGADLGFSRGGRIFKKISKVLSTFFLGRPNWFSELFQSTKKTLFRPKFLRRKQNFEKTGQKRRC